MLDIDARAVILGAEGRDDLVDHLVGDDATVADRRAGYECAEELALGHGGRSLGGSDRSAASGGV